MRRVAAIVLALAVVGILGAARAEASDKSVSILGVNQGFSPASVTVNPGDAVTWTNRDPTPAPHNAVCDESCPEPFSSGDPGPNGTTGTYRFHYSGTYRYECAVHPNMKGTVVVTGNVHPPAGATAGGAAPTTSLSAAAAGQPASGSRSGAGVANPGASGSQAASATSGTSTPSASASADGSAKTPLPPVGQLALPQPQVRVRQASSSGTPWWVLVPSSLLLVIASGACALAWLGPRPFRPLRRPAGAQG